MRSIRRWTACSHVEPFGLGARTIPRVGQDLRAKRRSGWRAMAGLPRARCIARNAAVRGREVWRMSHTGTTQDRTHMGMVM